MYDLERERELISLASEDPDLTPEEEYDFYKQYALRTKKDLLTEIREKQKNVRNIIVKKRSEEFFQRLDHLFNSFYEEVESHLIMEPLDNFWGYAFEVRDTGITLKLEHLVVFYDYTNIDYPGLSEYPTRLSFSSDDRFSIIEVRSKLLTLEEYGKAYGVKPGTVRQWIRRGKLRSASKFGNEWRVPELADKPKRGYASGNYSWKMDLPDPPVEVPNINSADSISIFQNLITGEWTARLECMNKKGQEMTIVLDSKTKEKLELYLISHPLVECNNTYILETDIKGSKYKMNSKNTMKQS